jgi:competence protein ComFC
MKRALDGLYPPICELCGCGLKDGNALCETCEEKLPRIISPFCETCGESFFGQVDGPFDCPNCKDISFHFEFALAAMDRCEETLELVHRLKYGKEIHLADALGKLACGVFLDRRFQVSLKEKWLLVPVPLHPSRLRKRHFNQAEEIARVVAKQCELPMMNLLKRVRKTSTQTRLSRKQRLENLKKAFELRNAWRKKNPTALRSVRGVIIVDDVFTTGSTVDACAKVLRKAGVKRVAVLTVLRG